LEAAVYGSNVTAGCLASASHTNAASLDHRHAFVQALDDLQSLFADKMRVSNSPMGYQTEASPVLILVRPKT